MPERRRASDSEVRLRRLLMGGAVAGHAAALLAIGLCMVFLGPTSGLAAALAAVGVLVFFIVGHAVQLRFADAPPRRIMFAALASYAIRVTALAALLALFLAHEDELGWIDRRALFAGAVASVLGWLVGEIATFRRLRIPAYDEPPGERDVDVRSSRGCC